MAHKSDLTEWLEENPRMMGVLWTMVLLLSQAGSVVAQGGATTGP